jgi:hypothetical protein
MKDFNMKQLFRIVCFALSVLMLFSFVSCGKKGNEEVEIPEGFLLAENENTDYYFFYPANWLLDRNDAGMTSAFVSETDFSNVSITAFTASANYKSLPDYVENYYFEQFKTKMPDKVLLNGPDESLLAGLVMGADGGIGTSYNILPGTVAEIYDSFVKGDTEKALAAQKKLNHLIASVAGMNIGHWKAFMEIMGFDMGHTVAPGTAVSPEKRKVYEQVLREL